MKKVVINVCYGGFGLSEDAHSLYKELSGRKRKIKSWKFKRDDPILIQVVETFGKKANGGYADLKIVEIPDDVEYEIYECDGVESIHEVHRVWF